MNGVTTKLAQSVLAIGFDSLPSSVVQKIKEILLDSIGCALGGYVTERAKIAIQLGETLGINPEATVIGHKRLSCPAASFVNGELINCLDFDVLGPVLGHVVPYVMPPALAVGEKLEVTGKDLIVALATAIEVGGRAGGSVSGLKRPKDEPPYYEDAPRASNNSTVFGAISGASKLLGLSERQIRSAFGVGGTTTPIPGNVKWEYLDEGNNVHIKYGCWTGWVAMLGTIATLATQKGLRGDLTILDGQHGYWQMYGSPFFKEDVLLGNLGKVWRLEEVSFKYYPCCGLHHTPIMGVQRLVRENSIKPEDIDEIVVYADAIMDTSTRWPPSVETNEDAQFSNAYLIALGTCYEGTPGPQWQMPSSWDNPKVRQLMPKVKVRLHPRAEELEAEKLKTGGNPVFWNSIIEISAKGEKFTTEVTTPKGMPANPMSVSELEDKFRHNASFSLVNQDKVERIIETIWSLDKLDNVTKLTRLFCIED